jgi:hypothetical protein
MKLKGATYILVLLIAVACSGGSSEEETPPNMSADKFTEVMIDVQLAEGMKTQKLAYTKSNGNDMNILYDHIFVKHDVSKDDFMEAFRYYRSRPGKMELIYEQVLDSLSKLDVEVKQKYSLEQDAEADSIQDATRRMRDSILKTRGLR